MFDKSPKAKPKIGNSNRGPARFASRHCERSEAIQTKAKGAEGAASSR
jgi:hypothetical protein